jgi:hypothetical protein
MRGSRFAVAPVEQRTLDGITFASKGEMVRYAELKLMQKAGLIYDLELQPAYPVEINNQHYCTYTADFSYRLAETDEKIVEDVKTSGTVKDASYRLRKKAAELYYGVEVFAVDKSGKSLSRKKRKLSGKR